MSPTVHHPLCDWNIEQRPDCCICGVYREAPWFEAYVRGVVGQTAHLRNALILDQTTDEEREQAA